MKLILAYEFNPYFELGIIGGAACGKVIAEGAPSELGFSCLPSGALEMRGIFGSERVQFSVHLRLGATAVAALGAYDLDTDDGDAAGRYLEEMHGAVSSSAAFSLAWRITPRVVFISAFTFDALPFVSPRDSFDLDCSSLSKCKRLAGEPRVSRALAFVPAFGVEVALTESLRLRTLMTPVIFNGIDASASYLGLAGSLEWGTAPRTASVQVPAPADGGPR